MPFALLTIGALFIIVGFQDTYKQFFTQLQSDFTGQNSFIYWLLAFGIVGALGYIDAFKNFSRALMALIFLAMIIADKGGVFNKFTAAVSSGSTAPVDSPGAALPADNGGGGSTNTSSDGSLESGGFLQDAGTVASVAALI